jgi:hypothetical protein
VANQPPSFPIARLDRTAEIQNQFLRWVPNFTFNRIRGKTQGLTNASSQKLSMPRVFVSKTRSRNEAESRHGRLF